MTPEQARERTEQIVSGSGWRDRRSMIEAIAAALLDAAKVPDKSISVPRDAKASDAIEYPVRDDSIDRACAKEATRVLVARIHELERMAMMHCPPPGHVRLPDGRDVPVLGELPMSEDDCAVGSDATLYRIAPDGSSEVLLTKHLSSGWYSTRAAAEAAKGAKGAKGAKP